MRGPFAFTFNKVSRPNKYVITCFTKAYAVVDNHGSLGLWIADSVDQVKTEIVNDTIKTNEFIPKELTLALTREMMTDGRIKIHEIAEAQPVLLRIPDDSEC